MKYLITESKLDNVVFMYLDNQDFIIKKSPKTSFGVSNIIHFLKSESSFRSDSLINFYRDGECFINFELIDEIATFFSMDFDDSKYVIGRWVEHTLDERVQEVHVR
jgi:hypothetical protein